MLHSGSTAMAYRPDASRASAGETAVTAVTRSKAAVSGIARTLTGVRCTSELTRLRSRHGCDRGTHHARRAHVEADGLHHLRVQLRHRGAPGGGRRGAEVRAHPRRQEPPVVARVHVREGAP